MKTIIGRIVTLRPATPGDRKQIFEWLADSDITSKMMGPPDFEDNPVPSWDYFVEDYNPHFFDDIDQDQGRSFIIEASDEDVGHINYNEIDRETNAVELDIWLAGSRYCNKGYGTDAIDVLCEFLAGNLGCTRFILAPSARNKNAVRAYEKCGFRVTTEIPRKFIPDYHDAVVMIKEVNK